MTHRGLASIAISLLATAAASESMPFETIGKGFNSEIEGTLTEVVRTPDDFRALWTRHGSNASPPPNPPAVDFEADMVACVFRGTQSSGGYGVEITSVEEAGGTDGGEIVVRYETSDPPPGAMVTMALTQPYHVVKVRASGRAVRFVGMAAPPPPPPFPTFLLTFTSDADPKTIVAGINDLESVSHAQLMTSLRIGMVHFDREKIDALAAQTLLMGIEGVATVEADPPFRS